MSELHPPAVEASTIRPNPDATVERLELGDGAWVDVSRGWLLGAGELYEALVEDVPWRQASLWRYEKAIEEPRVTAWYRTDQPAPHPAVLPLHRTLQHRYRARFDGYALAHYRDGRDSVAFHRDTDMRWLDETIIVILTLGARRPFLLRPRANRYSTASNQGATHDLAPIGGDLIVMGGSSQAGWEHAVPKVRGLTAGRMSIQWRWAAKTGRPYQGAGSRAPLHFSR